LSDHRRKRGVPLPVLTGLHRNGVSAVLVDHPYPILQCLLCKQKHRDFCARDDSRSAYASFQTFHAFENDPHCGHRRTPRSWRLQNSATPTERKPIFGKEESRRNGRTCIAIQRMIVPDLLKTQVESRLGNHESASQNSEIRTKAHQSTVLQSLQMFSSCMLQYQLCVGSFVHARFALRVAWLFKFFSGEMALCPYWTSGL